MDRAIVATLGALLVLGSTAGRALADGDPGTAQQQTSVGIQGLAVAGVHRDIAGSQYGAGAGALLQGNVVVGRVSLRLEGIPPVSIPQRASAFYGQATPSLSVFNGALRFAIDRRERLWIGAGTTIINQSTPLPNLFQVAGSRLAGARYELGYRAPLRGNRFAEVLIGAAPRLFGADRFIFSDGEASVDKPERAAEEDALFAVGTRRANSEVLFGFRTINFSAQFTRTGEAADRNNGAGLMVEWRRLIGH